MAAAAIVIPRPSSPTIESQRTSMISSSAASYQTAISAPRSPSTPQSFPSVSPSSSAHTLSVSSQPTTDFVNPIHVIAHQSQEVHLVKVTDNSVELDTESAHDSLLHKVGRTLTTTAPGITALNDSTKSYDSHVSQIPTDSEDLSSRVGPPPPSPPASDEHHSQSELHLGSSLRLEPKVAMLRPLTFETPMRERMPSATSTVSFEPSVVRQPRAGPSQPLHRASTETKTSISTYRTGVSPVTPRGQLSGLPHPIVTPDHVERFEASTSQSSRMTPIRSMSSHMSTDGYLQPPPPITSRLPKRRNTISSPMTPLISGYDDINADGELAEEIQQQQEQILRERISKRAKAQQEAEAALTRSKSKADPERPLVGNWIKEGHENYVMMYNMLTGIRIAVRYIISD
jgi:hypothetical protein